MVTVSELSINESANATQMAQEIFGDGVTVVGASYSGDICPDGNQTQKADNTADRYNTESTLRRREAQRLLPTAKVA